MSAEKQSQIHPVASNETSPEFGGAFLRVSGAREHNLKNISVSIPHGKMTVITGVSGSGKSSLAFDTIFSEGQMRYVESLSSYARQFLDRRGHPDVDDIQGLYPAIAIEQKAANNNPRSTVGTVTEIYDYLRVLWSRIGHPHCPQCGREISPLSVDVIAEKILAYPERTRLRLLAPVAHGRKGEFRSLLDKLRREGYLRVRIDGIDYELDEDISLDKTIRHNIDVVVDRLVVRPGNESRIASSLETALSLGEGVCSVETIPEGNETVYSTNYGCPVCGISLPEMNPRVFSFNNPYGSCPECSGLGVDMHIAPELLIADREKSLADGAMAPSGWRSAGEGNLSTAYYDAVGKKYGFTVHTPLKEVSEEGIHALLYGTGEDKLTVTYSNYGALRTQTKPFEGIIHNLERRFTQGEEEPQKYMVSTPCRVCGGKRLNPTILAVTVGGLSISDLTAMMVEDANEFFQKMTLTSYEASIAGELITEIQKRLGFLKQVGLSYLTLDRMASTLSGGEGQRIRLATQIGSGLTEVLYVLDEPSVGLHPADNRKLLNSLLSLRDAGNTLVVVEHDRDTICAADYVIDMGPGAGEQGGEVVASGTPEEIMMNPDSLTGAYLSGKRSIPHRKSPGKGNGYFLKILGAAENNLKNIDVAIPLGTLTCVTGISGAGKSTLVWEILYKQLARDLNHARIRPGKFRAIEGKEHLDKVIAIDQTPIGRTPHSNPATYIGVFDDIRRLFAMTPDAKTRGYGPGRFSFNVRGGRCEACRGDGRMILAMNFLPDVECECEVCHGKRFNRETLEVTFKGKNIADVLAMSAAEAVTLFENHPRIRRKLQALCDVGLGYMALGQSSLTLSGGEAQRVKLAAELTRPATGSTIYILDEPTTGLHFYDVEILLGILRKLVEEGNTVLVIEHNPDVISDADYLIDLGPEGGNGGGELVFCGTPEESVTCKRSHTGQYLKEMWSSANNQAKQIPGGAAPTGNFS